MLFTEALKKEVFGTSGKRPVVTNAMVVERSAVKIKSLHAPTALKPAMRSGNFDKGLKVKS